MAQLKKPLAMVLRRRLDLDDFFHPNQQTFQELRMLFETTWTSRRHRTDVAALCCLALVIQTLCLPIWRSGWASTMGRSR